MKRLFLNVFLVAAAVGVGIAVSIRPWQVYTQQQKITVQQIGEMRAAERRHAQDLEVEAHIGSSLGREELARKQGFRRQGEVPAGNSL
ncbi:MAG TPA: hypothetical protein VG944_05295 [Fimbriimonas sp.]|nr:hypothetical protein [Fimbriimonas sp.]